MTRTILQNRFLTQMPGIFFAIIGLPLQRDGWLVGGKGKRTSHRFRRFCSSMKSPLKHPFAAPKSALDACRHSRFSLGMTLGMIKAQWVLVFGLVGCGASAVSSSGEATKAPETGRDAEVFDAAGQAKTCEPPAKECAAPKSDPELQSRCALAGYRMVQCGCEMFCMGKPEPAEKMVFDSDGRPKACAKPKDDCSPPQASAAFQDACTDKGYRLEICGCEWLCSGNPAK